MPEQQWPALCHGETRLDEDEMLWRQIHPSWRDGDKIAKLAFQPGSGDDGQLSVSRASKISARDSHAEYVDDFGNRSSGVLAVTVAEVDDAGLRVVDDSGSVNAPKPCPTGHAYVDFRTGLSRSAVSRVSACLRDSAFARGWRYRPDVDE